MHRSTGQVKPWQHERPGFLGMAHSMSFVYWGWICCALANLKNFSSCLGLIWLILTSWRNQMHTTICRTLLTLLSNTLVLLSSWTLRVRIPAVLTLCSSLWVLFSHLVRGCCFVVAFCLEEQLAGCCWLTQWYSQRGKERVQDVSCRGLSSRSKTALNSEFIFPHLTRSLDWPCVHKIIPIRGVLLCALKKVFLFLILNQKMTNVDFTQ